MTSRTDTAIARRDKIAAALIAARDEAKRLNERIENLEFEARLAETEVLAAEAFDASDSLPVGTRVRHRSFADTFATVTPSDGTGIAVLQDGAAAIAYGFGPGEWLPID